VKGDELADKDENRLNAAERQTKSGTFLLCALCAMLFASLGCSSVDTKSYSSGLGNRTYAVASWYGPGFHGKQTSSGEVYDMYAMTCAHKVYPFGTRVKVINISNDRSAECVVNDRGPFIRGRDIDLSYGMAREIGIIGPGVARVLLELNGRDASYIRPVKVRVQEKSGPFTVQVGAFTESVSAVRLKAGLLEKYPNTYIQETEVNGTPLFRVRVGDYNDYQTTLSIAEQLRHDGYDTLLVKADVRI
jgi:rare lipoprotein A